MSKLAAPRQLNQLPNWPTARDWIGLGSFILTAIVLYMIAEYPKLREDEFFQTIATLIIGTGFINGPVSWAFGATKAGGELAETNAALVKTQAEKAAAEPQKVTVENTDKDPVPTSPQAPSDETGAPWNGMK
jgi:hypothetical protein